MESDYLLLLAILVFYINERTSLHVTTSKNKHKREFLKPPPRPFLQEKGLPVIEITVGIPTVKRLKNK